MTISKDKALQFKATLKDIKPDIWRRFIIPADFRLDQLHDVLQVLFGWVDYHLRRFTINGVEYGIPDPDDDFKTVDLDDSLYRLHELYKKVGQHSTYEYDFGDGWKISLVLEKVLDPDPEVKLPVCLDGKRSGPPEDVGGPWGYMDFLEAINDPSNDMHDQLLEWIGGKFDPEAYNLKAINQKLKGVENKKPPGEWEMEYVIVNPTMGLTTQSNWPEALSDEEIQILKDLPLRRDIVMMLNYINENKVVGTATTGNFPQKHFKEMCRRFVNPPEIDPVLHDGTVIILTSEYQVEEILFRHVLANNGYLIEGEASRRWKVTTFGNQFLVDTEAWQYWHLLVTWWVTTNWLYFSPIYQSDDIDYFQFIRLILRNLLSLREGKQILLADFVSKLAKQAKSAFPTFHMALKKDNLDIEERFIKELLVDPLSEFGILERFFVTKDWGNWQEEVLGSISITALGLSVLKALDNARQPSVN